MFHWTFIEFLILLILKITLSTLNLVPIIINITYDGIRIHLFLVVQEVSSSQEINIIDTKTFQNSMLNCKNTSVNVEK